MIKHTGERPYMCFYCEVAYTRKEKLREHCIEEHEMNVEEFLAKWETKYALKRGAQAKKTQ